MERKLDQVVRFVQNTPWAVKPEMLLTIRGIVAAHMAGVDLEPVAAAKPTPSPQQGGSVGVLPLWGVIVPHAGLMTNMSGGTSLDEWINEFRTLVSDPSISTIVLDVNSPGGSVEMVPEAAAEVRAARGRKRIVSVANPEIASAAYWIASQADELVMPMSGMVGSIGVIAEHTDQSKLEEMAGITRTFITAGDFKAEQLGPLSEDAKANIQKNVDQFYTMFVGDIAKGRGVTPTVVKNTYGQGRMLNSVDAMNAGMVDRIGTLDTVLAKEVPSGKPRQKALLRGDSEEVDVSSFSIEDDPVGELEAPPKTSLVPIDEAVAATDWFMQNHIYANTTTGIAGQVTGTSGSLASITFTEPPPDTSPGQIVAGAIAPHSTPVIDEPWDGGAVEKALPTDNQQGWKSVYAWYDSSGADPDGDGLPDAKADWKFPHHTRVGGPANINGVNNAKARLSNSNIPAGDKAGVEAHLQRHQDDWAKSQKKSGSALRAADNRIPLKEGKMDEERMTLDELVARKDEIKARMQELHVEAEGRQFYEEEQEAFNELDKERQALEAAITNIDEREARLALIFGNKDPNRTVSGDGASVPQRTNGQRKNGRDGFYTSIANLPENIYDLTAYRGFSNTPEEMNNLYREGARRVIEQSPFEANEDGAKTHADKLLRRDKDAIFAKRVLTTGSDLYDRAFGKMVMGKPLSSHEDAAIKAAVSETGLGSELPVPITIDPTVLLTSDGAINPLRQIARNITITGLHWQGISSDGLDVTYEAELTQVADQTPNFAAPSATVAKAHAYVEFSMEVDQDWGELRSNLQIMFQDAKDMKEANKFLLGSGTNEPYGLLTALNAGAASAVLETATAHVFAVGDVYHMQSDLAPRFRSSAVWLASDMVFSQIRQFDVYGGSALWAQLGADRPAVLLGKNVYELSTMSQLYTTGGEDILIYGDFGRGFVIIDRIGLNVELIPHVLGANRRPTGSRALYAYFRNTSTLLTAKAFNVLRVKAT